MGRCVRGTCRCWSVPGKLALVLAITLGALACPVDSALAQRPADRIEARRLGGEAMDLFTAGDYAAALEKFEAADRLVPAPTLKLRIARCLDKLDRMREAAARYREVIETELGRGAPQVHREARDLAVFELAALLEQIPTIEVGVRGAGAAGATVEIDGTPIAPDEPSAKHQVDPGLHAVAVRHDRGIEHRSVRVERGGHELVQVELESDLPESPMRRRGGDAEDESGSATGTVGWVALGIGAAGLVMGMATGIAVLSEKGDLSDRCPDGGCPPEAHDDARAFDRLRGASTAGFVIAGIGAVTGATLLLFASEEQEPTRGRGAPAHARVVPYVTVAGGGIRGAF